MGVVNYEEKKAELAKLAKEAKTSSRGVWRPSRLATMQRNTMKAMKVALVASVIRKEVHVNAGTDALLPVPARRGGGSVRHRGACSGAFPR